MLLLFWMWVYWFFFRKIGEILDMVGFFPNLEFSMSIARFWEISFFFFTKLWLAVSCRVSTCSSYFRAWNSCGWFECCDIICCFNKNTYPVIRNTVYRIELAFWTPEFCSVPWSAFGHVAQALWLLVFCLYSGYDSTTPLSGKWEPTVMEKPMGDLRVVQ